MGSLQDIQSAELYKENDQFILFPCINHCQYFCVYFSETFLCVYVEGGNFLRHILRSAAKSLYFQNLNLVSTLRPCSFE